MGILSETMDGNSTDDSYRACLNRFMDSPITRSDYGLLLFVSISIVLPYQEAQTSEELGFYYNIVIIKENINLMQSESRCRYRKD